MKLIEIDTGEWLNMANIVYISKELAGWNYKTVDGLVYYGNSPFECYIKLIGE